MSDVIINIHGGNNQILPNATEAVQNFYGDRPAGQTQQDAAAGEAGSPEAERLAIYIDKVNIPRYLARISLCRTATELGMVVVDMAGQEPRLTPEEMVKERFISLLLPFATGLAKGATVDNVRQRINDAWARRPRLSPRT